jgi:hypothetical protein
MGEGGLEVSACTMPWFVGGSQVQVTNVVTGVAYKDETPSGLSIRVLFIGHKKRAFDACGVSVKSA